ncbi:Crp/Fnr family transcriptional regulator [Sphingobacterium sp. SRCM116780]|uniref:Crp/Fnr family transcriptional regulator n=1 Tax=Sphingobacterium sp. SRCM116780 TaxID=2907623 RepID=UPI001F23CDC2|nr:Crp/Fnr family transcriptional regulator [Sphingobacterium sp. SRCM116780]UIR57291.1 Crp/Fnr family transcriptional regulator [Sphingobacterium sp. SRCM116780]
MSIIVLLKDHMIEQYFDSFGIFSKEEIESFTSLFQYRKLNKTDFFVKENQKCTEIAFIQSGIIRSYYMTADGQDMTYCFRFPNDLIAAYSSFLTGNLSIESMQAITVVELLVIKKSTVDQLVSENPNWIKFLKIIAEHQYLELEKRVFQLQKESALQRYSSLLKNQPQYIQQISLQYIASYLGITQRHLSRIRKEVMI